MAGYEADEIDFSGITDEEASGRRVIPSGKYVATVEKVEINEKPAGPCFLFVYRVIEGDEAGVKLVQSCSMGEKSRAITFRTIQSILGEPLPRVRFGNFMAEYGERLVGQVVTLTVGTSDWSGEPGNDVKFVSRSRSTGTNSTKPEVVTKTKKMF
jgi:hypothetical protein